MNWLKNKYDFKMDLKELHSKEFNEVLSSLSYKKLIIPFIFISIVLAIFYAFLAYTNVPEKETFETIIHNGNHSEPHLSNKFISELEFIVDDGDSVAKGQVICYMKGNRPMYQNLLKIKKNITLIKESIDSGEIVLPAIDCSNSIYCVMYNQLLQSCKESVDLEENLKIVYDFLEIVEHKEKHIVLKATNNGTINILKIKDIKPKDSIYYIKSGQFDLSKIYATINNLSTAQKDDIAKADSINIYIPNYPISFITNKSFVHDKEIDQDKKFVIFFKDVNNLEKTSLPHTSKAVTEIYTNKESIFKYIIK